MRMLKAYWMQNCCFMNTLDKKIENTNMLDNFKV